MSDLPKRLTGTFIPDEPKQPVAAWLQEELRYGRLRPLIERFIESQGEALEISGLIVDNVTPASIRCRIPRFMTDHESSRPFRADVEFEFDPRTGGVFRYF